LASLVVIIRVTDRCPQPNVQIFDAKECINDSLFIDIWSCSFKTLNEAPVKPKAIIMVGTYAACAKFIRIINRALSDVIYMNVSFVASNALKNALGSDGEGIIITQVVPHFESNLQLTREYLKDLKSYAPEAEPDFISLEGYIVARIFIEGLKRAGPDVDKETIIDAILSIKNLDIGMGTLIRYTNENYQGSQKVWPTIIRNGRFESFDFKSLTN